MLRVSDDVTESVPKNRNRLVYLFLLILFVGLLISLPLIFSKSKLSSCPIAIQTKESGKVAFADTYTPETCIKLELADTSAKRVAGLSGRPSMGVDQGMLFIFDEPGNHCIWMKDMKFAIDIVWIDENKIITDIKKNTKPETYPESFCPSKNAKYVIELNNGVAEQAKLEVGKQIYL